MPIRMYRLKKMPDGPEHPVTREEYRYTFLHDFILQGPMSDAKLESIQEWLDGKDRAWLFLGKQFWGRVIELPTIEEAQIFNLHDETLATISAIENSPELYMAYVRESEQRS